MQFLLSSIGKYVDQACANALKHGTITVSGFGYFHKNCRFLWKKNVSKTNLGSTIQYIYTSYNKYFGLCMVSEELRLNEIGLFLQQYRNQNAFSQRTPSLNALLYPTFFVSSLHVYNINQLSIFNFSMIAYLSHTNTEM